MAESKKLYFANLPDDKIAPEIWARIENFYTVVQNDELFQKQQKSWSYHYGASELGSSSEVLNGGEAGETAQYMSNIIGSATSMVIAMLTSGRLNAETSTPGTSAAALKKSQKTKATVDYVMGQEAETLSMYSAMQRAARHIKVLGESWGYVEWNAFAGKILGTDPDSGDPIFAGRNEFHALAPLDVARPTNGRGNNPDWVALRFYVNKWSLAARVRKEIEEAAEDLIADGKKDEAEALLERLDEIEEHILSKSSNMTSIVDSSYSGLFSVLNPLATVGQYGADMYDDQCCLFLFMHKPCAAVPRGKEVLLLGPEMVLAARDLDADEGGLRVRRAAEADVIGRWGGFTPVFNALAPQEALNEVSTVMQTNFKNAGLINLAVQRGANMDSRTSEFNLTVLEYDTAPPEIIQGNALPEQHFKYAQSLKDDLLTMIGTNPISMGQVPYANMTAEAVTTLDSKTIQFSSLAEGALVGLSQFYVKQAVRNLSVNMSQAGMKVPFKDGDVSTLLDVSAEDISDMDAVTITLNSPMARTGSGMGIIMNALVQSMGTPNGPEILATLLETGSIKPTLNPLANKTIMLAQEKDMLAQGQVPPAFPSDDHQSHIAAAHEVLLDEKNRFNTAVVQAVTEFIQEHEMLQASQPQQQAPAPPAPGGGMGNAAAQSLSQTLAPPSPGQPAQQ